MNLNKLNSSLWLLFAGILLSCSIKAQTVNKEPSEIAISVQLHSVKNALISDFQGTLIKLADMGFTGVEFAGKYGPYQDKPLALKQFLASIGLSVSGAHLSVKQLRGEQGINNLKFLQSLGAKLIIIPHDERINKPEKIDELMAELTQLSNKVNQLGLTLGYHNHAKEFAPFNGLTFWDYLAQSTPENFALQLDTGWAKFAGVDPLTYVNRYPNRTLTTHIKIRTTADKTMMNKISSDIPVVIGEDNYSWKILIEAMRTTGGTQWLVIEQEETHFGKTRLETVYESLKGLQKILNSSKS